MHAPICVLKTSVIWYKCAPDVSYVGCCIYSTLGQSYSLIFSKDSGHRGFWGDLATYERASLHEVKKGNYSKSLIAHQSSHK